jgi:hypothetical protein
MVKAINLSRIFVCLALAVLVVYGAYWSTTQATSGLIAWDTGLTIQLPAYNSTVGADDTLFFSQFQWNTSNATQVTFSTVRMGTGSPISALGVSSDVNMTFDSLATDKFSYLVNNVGSQNFTGVTEPDSVKIDGVLTTSGWTYNSGELKVDSATTSVEVLFNVGLLTSEDAVAIAIAFGVIAIALAVVFSYVRKKRNDDND